MVHTILVPTDGSPAAQAALRHALEIALDTGASVYLLSVIEPRNPLVFGVSDTEDLEQAIGEMANSVLDSVDTGAVHMQTDIRRGEPVHEQILAVANEIDADVIIMGQHGSSSLPEGIFGSTADRVARLAPIPVTITPPTETT